MPKHKGRFWPPMRVVLCVAALLLAGCANGTAPEADEKVEGFKDVDVYVDEDHGAVLGIVVDAAIRPVAGASINITTVQPPLRAETDDEGRFVLDRVPAGPQLIEVWKLNHETVQVSVEVEAGVADPQLIKVQLPRLFSADPFMQTSHFAGNIECGWAVRGVGSSLCANDYTRFVPIIGNDPKCPQCEHLLGDNRGHDFEIGAGWQTAIFEMTWEPSAQGTSQRMKLILSHTPRPATHWYAATASEDPLLLRVELGEVHEDQQSEPQLIPPEGLENAHFFAATDPPEDERVSLAISQDFDVFYTLFHYGKPPEGWSFIAGDEDPF